MFLSRLSKVRMEQMGPLCTASLEQGSYQRAYDYIVRSERSLVIIYIYIYIYIYTCYVVTSSTEPES